MERYFCLVKKPALAAELADMGIYLQVNAGGVLGHYGRKEKRLIKKMFATGNISFVATDAHDTERRKQELSEAAAYVEKKFGRDTMEACFHDNPQAIVKHNII
jgi:protein-tyrosine phosphatase